MKLWQRWTLALVGISCAWMSGAFSMIEGGNDGEAYWAVFLGIVALAAVLIVAKVVKVEGASE